MCAFFWNTVNCSTQQPLLLNKPWSVCFRCVFWSHGVFQLCGRFSCVLLPAVTAPLIWRRLQWALGPPARMLAELAVAIATTKYQFRRFRFKTALLYVYTVSAADTSRRGLEIRKVDSDYISCSISFAHPKDPFVLGLLSNMSEIVSGFKFTGDLYWNLSLQCGSCNKVEMSFKCHLVIREIWLNEKMWNESFFLFFVILCFQGRPPPPPSQCL